MADLNYHEFLQAQEYYHRAHAEYDETLEKYQLGQIDKTFYDEALETLQQARAEFKAFSHKKL